MTDEDKFMMLVSGTFGIRKFPRSLMVLNSRLLSCRRIVTDREASLSNAGSFAWEEMSRGLTL